MCDISQKADKVCKNALKSHICLDLIKATLRFGQYTKAMKKILVALGILGLIGSASAANLAGTRWQLATLNNVPVSDNMLKVDLQVDGNNFSGFTGCNSYSGQLSAKTFAIGGQSRMVCDKNLMSRENQFLKLIQSAAIQKADDNQLVLRSKIGTLVFKRS